jgi:hypothetical protein
VVEQHLDGQHHLFVREIKHRVEYPRSCEMRAEACRPMRSCRSARSRQWVLSLPHALRFLLASDPAALTLVLGVV